MIGTTLGPYRIDRELGSGGMGRVYAATGPDGVVALKVVHSHLLETPGCLERFLREAEVGRSVTHENVVRTLGCDAAGHAAAPSRRRFASTSARWARPRTCRIRRSSSPPSTRCSGGTRLPRGPRR